ncbi:hypothetical protein CRG98_033501 [Punica granatum]|uniref:Carboxypeptidase n=1 Tax=Punica granatum TaxID=22663 RepID=A0A2I0IRN4_PUNGR|nr:hypothetical protein CRG98_033501 [Punica granatum]
MLYDFNHIMHPLVAHSLDLDLDLDQIIVIPCPVIMISTLHCSVSGHYFFVSDPTLQKGTSSSSSHWPELVFPTPMHPPTMIWVGDSGKAHDSYVFLINWLERFPEYKAREFYLTGESYTGHYAPQLAPKILRHKGYYETTQTGDFDYYWTHGLISDEIHEAFSSTWDFTSTIAMTDSCRGVVKEAYWAIRDRDHYDIYAPLCKASSRCYFAG